jgi:hypothetical protein
MLIRTSCTLDMRPVVIGLTLCTGLCATAAQAQIFSVDTFRTAEYTQTGNGNSLTLNGYYFSAQLLSVNPNDFSAVQLTYPGPGSPVSLSVIDPRLFQYQSSLFSNQAGLDAAFPFGTYQFSASNGVVSTPTSLNYSSDLYPTALPYLTGTNFTDLQGLNAATPTTFDFSSFPTDPLADAQRIDLRIYASPSDNLIYDSGLLASTTASVSLPANTLQAGQSYFYQLNFTNYLGQNAPNSQFGGTVDFDDQTLGAFTTAAAPTVPEPGAATLLGCLSLAGLLVRRRRSS